MTPLPWVRPHRMGDRPPMPGRLCHDDAVTLVIAHRGASFAEPENTIAAFRRARELGADGVELDVRRSADDHLVVHHDPRLTDGRVVRATPRAELPDAVPTLSDALDACAGMFVNVEIKNDPDEPDFDGAEWIADRTTEELARRGTHDRWLISSFRRETVERCRRLLPSVETALLVMNLTDRAIERTVGGGHVAVHPDVSTLSSNAVRAAHAAGLRVNTWTCDDPDRMRELMAWGVDGVCTNVPDVAVAVRSEVSG